MADTPSELDIIQLRSNIHGEHVAEAHVCDYCGTEVKIGQPVQYDVIRVADLPNIERIFSPPSEWHPDAVRCQNCNIDKIDPATDGFDEALVMVHLNESNGILSIDASSMTVVDFSPNGDGYQPPMFSPVLMSQFEDLGLARWIRVKHLLEFDDGSGDVMPIIRKGVRKSKDIPPNVEF
ncbi:hypothetical protein [Haloferax profundi]|uniref:Uncharacterized protein n=1 Tax=Haloferax profundi TaxID=1544718 RepID=A0A0W1RSN0_9EURY|nr:hypothetical protein [Haloferax profundi]KTG16553.1 hypothetical protein AUR66_18615 [Haloferax profundi]